MKHYYHNQSEDSIREFMERHRYTINALHLYFEKPPWCGNSLALDQNDYCQTLIYHNVKNKCRCCRCLHLIEDDQCCECERFGDGTIKD